MGKWHLEGAKTKNRPLARGFESFLGLLGASIDHYTQKTTGNDRDLWRNEDEVPREKVDEKEHATNLFTREAIGVIERHAATAAAAAGGREGGIDPLFLYLAYTAPHTPLQAYAKYLDICKEVPNRHRRTFCAMMAQLDEGVGNVTRALRENRMWEDTVVVFSSDNGGSFMVGGFNYMYRGGKSTGWEGGVRVPGFVRAPESFGFWTEEDFGGMVHVADWMPTLVGLAGGREGREGGRDGYGLGRVFRGEEESPRREALVQMDVFRNSSAYRSGCLKVRGGEGGREGGREGGGRSKYDMVQMDVFQNASAYRSGCLKVRGGEGRREEGGGEMGLLESHSFPPEIRNRLVIERGKVIRIAMTH